MLVTDRIFWRWYLFFVVGCSAWYLYQWRNNSGTWFFLVLAIALLSLFALVLINSINLSRFYINSPKISKFITWPFSIVLTFLTTILSINNLDTINFKLSDRLLLLLVASGIAVILLKLSDPDRISAIDFLLLMLLGAVIYKICSFVPEIQSVPFSLGWSEGSRYYNASLFFSDRIYGKELALPVLHPSRYLLQTIPFIIGIKSILIHRLWQVILWLSLNRTW